jgi:hypothetical protein
VGTLSLKDQVRYDRYKDMFQEEGKIGEVTEAKAAIGEGAIVMKEIDMRKIGIIPRTEI